MGLFSGTKVSTGLDLRDLKAENESISRELFFRAIGRRKWCVERRDYDFSETVLVYPKLGDPRPKQVRRFPLEYGQGPLDVQDRILQSFLPVKPRPGASTRPFFRGHGRYAR